MMTNRSFIVPAFMVLAVALSFATGWTANGGTCDPADCASACEVMTPAECAATCPPECIALCDEPCAESCAKSASVDCAPGSDISACAMGTTAKGGTALIDPTGQLSFQLHDGQTTQIMK